MLRISVKPRAGDRSSGAIGLESKPITSLLSFKTSPMQPNYEQIKDVLMFMVCFASNLFAFLQPPDCIDKLWPATYHTGVLRIVKT